MKKSTALGTLFLFTFGLAAGITVTLHQDAHAIPQCVYECLYELERSDDTGPLCPNPATPYYLYKRATCIGGPLVCYPLSMVIGCCPSPEPDVGLCQLIRQ